MAAGTYVDTMLLGALSVVVILAVIVTSVHLIFFKKRNLPPGPYGLIPYVGYALNIVYALYKGVPLYKYLLQLGHRYGQVYSFTAFGIPVIVLNDLQSIREAFQDTKLNDRGDNELQAKTFSRVYNKWNDMAPFRNFALSCFHQFGIGTSRFEKSIAEESAFLIEELANLNGEPVELTWYLNNAVSNIMTKVVFGTRFEITDERFRHLTDLMNRHTQLAGSGGLAQFVPINIQSKEKQEIFNLLDEIQDFINGIVDSHRESFDPNNLIDITDIWLDEIRLRKSDDPGSFRNPSNIIGLIYVLLLGGVDTTSTTLRWATQYLVKYPEVQARIHHELDTVVGRNRLPRFTDKPNLPYCEAVIMELHRIITLLPLSAFHVAGETTKFRGYTIPKNSVVISNLYAVMHSPEIWGDPEVFRPERFIDNEGKLIDREEVVPFGLGRRRCLGEALAKQELFIFFTHLLHQFKFEKPSKNAPAPTLEPIDGIVTHPGPYHLCVNARE